jgi:hypothetical protein
MHKLIFSLNKLSIQVMKTAIAILVFIIIIPAMALMADEPVSPAREVFTGYDIYASTIVKEDTVWKQWFAGWISESDKPWDRMYYSFSKDSGSSWTEPIEAFTIENVQVNDPSVLRLWDAVNSRYYYQMYYTYYPSGLGNPTNYIAVSTSMDGLNWTHLGVLIGTDNGIDTDGAWAPSAYSVDSLASEVFLYFHNNHPDGKIFRTTLTNSGLIFDKSSTIAVTSSGGLRANPDVSRSPDGTWWMFYNGSSLTSGGKGNFNTCKMYSADGLNWRESGHNPIQEYEDMTTTTPHILWTGPDSYQLWYGYGTPSFLDFDVFMQAYQSVAEPDNYIVASSEALKILGATMAVDKDPHTFWSSAGHPGSGDHMEWIYLNEGEPKEISLVELIPRSVDGSAMCFPIDFTLQHSSDGLNWTDIDGQTYTNYQCADTLTQRFRFDNIISDQYFRLFATKLSADSYGNFYCQIAEISLSDDTTSVGIETQSLRSKPESIQNYPNPFTHSTTISYSLEKTTYIRLEVFDIFGRKVDELVDETQSAGTHNIPWSGPEIYEPNCAGSCYLLRLTADGQIFTRKMLVIQIQ